MRRSITTFSLLALMLGLVSPALAVEGTGVPSVREEFEAKRQEVQNQIQENRDKLREARGELKEEVRTLKDERQDVRQNLREIIPGALTRARVSVRVFEATITRLNVLIGRMESRIQKLSDNGGNTTEATNLVNAAKADILEAQTHIENIKAINLEEDASESLASSTDPVATSTSFVSLKEKFAQIREEARLAKEELVSAKKNLQSALGEIKKVERSQRGETATSTATTTDDNE